MSTLFVNQPLTLPQKIDSREGFLMQKGVSLCMQQNEYLFQKATICTSFGVFWC